MHASFIYLGLTIYFLILLFIFVDLAYVYKTYSIHPLQAIPLALGVELLAAYFSAIAIYYGKYILKTIAISFALFVWFLVMTASTQLWTKVTILSVATTLFVPFANLILPSILAYLLQQKQTQDGQDEPSETTPISQNIKHQKQKQKKTKIIRIEDDQVMYNVIANRNLIQLINSRPDLKQYIDVIAKHVLPRHNVVIVKDLKVVDSQGNIIDLPVQIVNNDLLQQLNNIRIQLAS